MTAYEQCLAKMQSQPATWLVTGAAGFIGSHLLETLLANNQTVTAIDNFSTGYQHNLDNVKTKVTAEQWQRFTFVKGDIRDLDTCKKVVKAVDYVLHQAALGSVPRSVAQPLTSNAVNIDGFLNMLIAARDAKVKRFVFAASSSTYGDSAVLPKVEDEIGKPLSPYALTKYVNELYADVFARTYGTPYVGLRYFNVFGERQDANGAYAAVIPRWFDALIHQKPVEIYGDGETSRDFCYIKNAVQANLLAATTESVNAINQIYNVAVGERTTLNELFAYIKALSSTQNPSIAAAQPIYKDFRQGDVRHSLADIAKASSLLGYMPSHKAKEGLVQASQWYFSK